MRWVTTARMTEKRGTMQDDDAAPKRPGVDDLLRVATEEVRKVAYGGKYRAAVTQYKDGIEDLLRSGYTWEVAWLAVRRAAGSEMSYPSFRRHCRALGIERWRADPQRRTSREDPPPPTVKARLPNGLPVFHHSPVPDRRELYGDDD